MKKLLIIFLSIGGLATSCKTETKKEKKVENVVSAVEITTVDNQNITDQIVASGPIGFKI